MKLSNRTYDVLKWVAQILLPACGAAYYGLAKIWPLPYGEEVVGTITVLDTFRHAGIRRRGKGLKNAVSSLSASSYVDITGNVWEDFAP